MLSLKTRGLNNAAAVLGGYDALVQAGFPIETGKAKASTVLTEPEKKVEAVPTPAAPTNQATAPSSTPAKRSKRHARKRRHRKQQAAGKQADGSRQEMRSKRQARPD